MIDNRSRTGIARQLRRWRPLAIACVGAFAIALIVSAAMARGGGGGQAEFDDARMIIEFNDTDQDVGIQMFIDGEEWRRLRVFAPDGEKVLDIRTKDAIRQQGLTELFFESSEPSLDELSLEEFFERFPEGQYELEGVTIDGEDIEGEATFTHVIPAGPVIVSPEEDSVQDVDDTVVEWLAVPDPADSTIEAYQVIVTELIDVLPSRTFSVHVPASVTSVTVPAEFLQPGSEYEFEVLAIEAGGNQTISSSFFSTSP